MLIQYDESLIFALSMQNDEYFKALCRSLFIFLQIEQQYGRNITQADKVVMATEYQDQKTLKAKIRLLDALIEKHASQLR